jgi:hypothetical protein
VQFLESSKVWHSDRLEIVWRILDKHEALVRCPSPLKRVLAHNQTQTRLSSGRLFDYLRTQYKLGSTLEKVRGREGGGGEGDELLEIITENFHESIARRIIHSSSTSTKVAMDSI